MGIGMRRRGWKVVGWDPEEARLEDAANVGATDETATSLSDLYETDLVLLAGPLGGIIETIPALPDTLVVTDVAGLKAPVADAAAHLKCFIPGHPMAGREFSGPTGASGSMFRGANWILCTDGRDGDAISMVEDMIESLGANPLYMTAAAHDQAVGAVSHLPQLVAATLVDMIENDTVTELAAGGFRDVTRIAQSEPRWWTDILMSNAEVLVPIIDDMRSRFETLKDAMEEGDSAFVETFLGRARKSRMKLAAPVDSVRMVIEDRPGEFAKVGAALAESGVDLRDLQLRHATDGGGGVLTLSVRKGEAEALTDALTEHDFRIIP